MKIKKLLPVLLLLALALSLCLLAGCAVQNTAPAAENPAAQGRELTLITPTSLQTPKPTQSPKPTPLQTPKPARTPKPSQTPKAAQEPEILDEYESYTTKDDVALYIHTYGHLPPNFITKKEAQAAGWFGGSLEQVLPGMCIGGDYFGNYEGQLPKAKGRKWAECDVNTLGKKSRGPERIIFSNDGLIYYTPDHYESFELLYD
ncbi:MAG: ribonuclease [Oscillospiraceae bacterium]|nr:ribonuclease [Oscillospiraceae bacterium]